jgi:hypothetical protein
MSKLPKRVDELIDELYENANLTNKKRLDELVRTLHASMIPAIQGGVMKVESMVASKTKNPMVIFSWNDNRGELTPIQARGYCMQILEACEAATQDAALYDAVVNTMKMDGATAFRLITAVRGHRRKFEDE